MKIRLSAGVVALVLVLTPALLCICRWTCPVHPATQAAATSEHCHEAAGTQSPFKISGARDCHPHADAFVVAAARIETSTDVSVVRGTGDAVESTLTPPLSTGEMFFSVNSRPFPLPPFFPRI